MRNVGDWLCCSEYPRRLATLVPKALIAAVLISLSLVGCSKRTANDARESQPASAKRYAYGDWSDWQVDCTRRTSNPDLPCAAARKRVCQVEGTREGVDCTYCGGQCKEEVTDQNPPLYLYSAWSAWNSHCRQCSAEPTPCQAERERVCLNRLTGNPIDCEFCGGACKESEDRVSSCAPECKWTRVHAYSDDACTVEIRDDPVAGEWGPQTNSPFNAGCSETQWSDRCVKFGQAYYKWEPCVSGCSPPVKK
jgi:hypothetical protein